MSFTIVTRKRTGIGSDLASVVGAIAHARTMGEFAQAPINLDSASGYGVPREGV
ncbi:MAG: hypothetical protein AB7O98_16850 [Hyphomonadaceae bacterium]